MSRKVFFKYGVMGSSKSFDLIRADFNYKERGLRTLVIIPKIDTRSEGRIKSRIGISVGALAVDETDNIFELVKKEQSKERKKIKAVFADEAHFFTPEQIDELTDVADVLGITVICYGLRTDFRNKLFPASKRLLEVADEIDEIKAMCKCGNKSTYNARFIDNKPVFSGDQIHIGDEEYRPFCRKCYKKLSN